MYFSEKKVSLVGWGKNQVVFHLFNNGNCGISVVENGHIVCFGLTPWLRGRISIAHTAARYTHGTPPKPEYATMVSGMRDGAMAAAMTALRTHDVYLLAEAVSTTYMAQQYMGAELLPNKGEIGKRFSDRCGVYLYASADAIHADKLVAA